MEQLRRLLERAYELDCWVTVYPSLKNDQMWFAVQVSDENDLTPAGATSDDLGRACDNTLAILEEAVQKGAFE